MNLAENIKTLREKNNLTQEEFGNLVGVSRSAISKWERDLSSPPIDSIKAIANFFKVTVDELTGTSSIDPYNYVNNLHNIKRSINNNNILSYRNRILFIVPIINIALLLLVISSLLVVLVTAYKEYNNQEANTKLVYSNIESVSLKIHYPDSKIIDVKMEKSILSKEFYVDEREIFGKNNSEDYLFKIRFSIMVEFKVGNSSDLSRSKQLVIVNSDKYVKFDNPGVYPYLIEPGIYSFKFYIANEMGYLEVFCDNN